MATVTVELPDTVLAELRTLAMTRSCSVAQVAAERICSPRQETSSTPTQRAMQKLRDRGLIAPDESKLGPQLADTVRPVSYERRMELARKLSATGPLSEAIIEERRMGP